MINIAERERIYNLPIKEHIKQSFCPECRPGIKYECCNDCLLNKGFYGEKEKERRFTPKQIEEVESQWNDQTGFLGEFGCVLRRELRSEKCLRVICNIHRQRMNILY